MTTPMMKCGHAANAIHRKSDGTNEPCCVICAGINEGAYQIDESYSIPEGRKARCSYYGRKPTGRLFECNYGGKPSEPCTCEQPSNTELPFFEQKPNQEYDEFYCGCWGWD